MRQKECFMVIYKDEGNRQKLNQKITVIHLHFNHL